MSALSPAEPVAILAPDGRHLAMVCPCHACARTRETTYNPAPPPRPISAKALALVRLEAVLENAGWFVACARAACLDEGDNALAARLTWLEEVLSRSTRLTRDEAFPITPVVPT